MDAQHSRSLLDLLFSTESMREVFSDQVRLESMLMFEAALARVEAQVSIIPERAAEAIGRHCRVEFFDVDTLAQETALAGNLAIPLVQALTDFVARDDPDAAQFVHWGATSQDVIDTGLVLQLRAALNFLDEDLARLVEAYTRLARTYAATPLAGRTWMQQAAPITFGLKVAGWLSAVKRAQERLSEMRPRTLVLQLGGSVGSLAAFGEQGLEVASRLAEELTLFKPDIPWHTQRDRVAEVATTLGLLVGTLGKIARDLSLLAQTEVGEAREPSSPGRGGSSTMPQKRNPVGAAVALAAAQRVPGLVATMLAAIPQEHERGLGGWQAEWETLPEICLLAAGALHQMVEVAEGLELDPDRMDANLDLTQGAICAEAVSMALARHIGKSAAHHLVAEASRNALDGHVPLRAALAEIPQVAALLSADELDRLCNPRNATGIADQLIRRALAD